ncbi:bromodomain-containing protein DDB_G0270170-like isoform X2 [Ctenocephalides felis]|nr:bromodomain-containing protein DDB_G0270170-like isoform X2 [Ctenocephalides felis]
MRQKDSKKRKRKRKPAQTSTMRGYRMSRPLYSPRTTVTKSPTNNYFNKSMNSVSPKRTSPLLARRLNISNKTYNSSMRTVSNNNNILNSSNTSMSDHKSKTISRQQTQDRNMVSSSSTGSVRTRSNSNNSINSLPSIKSSPEPSNNSYCSINNTRDVQKPNVTKSIHTAKSDNNMSQELSCDYIKNVSQTSPTINNLNKPKGIETLNDQKSAEIQNIAKSPKGFFDSEDNASDKSSSVQHPDLSHHISDKIRNNLKTLIKNFPKGVSLTSIDSHYENNFGEKLSYNELGFPNALEFFLQLSDIFWLERISEFGEFILFDQSLKIPEDLIKNLKVQEKGVEKDIEDVSAVCKDETFKKIMEICNSEETLSGMMGPGDVIESIWNKCKFSCGCLMRIIITEIYDPTKFWFVLDDEDHFQLMNKMMDEMQEYYENNQESLKINNLQKNMYCAASYANSWQRAYIVDVEETTKVKLYFIDYGSLIVADTSTIRYLSKDFQSLPKQVIRGRLDFIIPTNNSTHWDLFVCRFFFKLIEERRLLCLTTEIDEENNIIWMTIKDFEHHKTNPETLTLNEILVKKGYAAICPVSDQQDDSDHSDDDQSDDDIESDDSDDELDNDEYLSDECFFEKLEKLLDTYT